MKLLYRGFKYVISVLAVIALFTNMASAASDVTGQWSQNQMAMYGSVIGVSWWEPRMRSIQGISTAYSTPHPQHLVQVITVVVTFQDRCKKYDGTWAQWRTNGTNSKGVSMATTTGYVPAQGQYQDCTYGHQYLDKSTHVFANPATGLNTTKDLSYQY